ncbi:integration host factor subunit beta [Alphaproteobacteria bacterium]|nr:integration host factor subunit beta [Alphaproteobacteria bacterium]
MNKSDLIIKIMNLNSQVNQTEIEKSVNTFFDTITISLTNSQKVELRGFGSFGVKKREARLARNPKTGSTVAVSAKKISFFKMGKGMKEQLNN